jgi:hypothetical protein
MSVLALGLLLLFGAVSAFGDSLPMPVEKKIPAGETTIQYAGQSLRFTTSVTLFVRLEPLSETRIQFRVKLYPGQPMPSGPAGSSENNIEIHWLNYGTDIYEGGAPSGVIEGVLNTEGGFVDR